PPQLRIQRLLRNLHRRPRRRRRPPPRRPNEALARPLTLASAPKVSPRLLELCRPNPLVATARIEKDKMSASFASANERAHHDSPPLRCRTPRKSSDFCSQNLGPPRCRQNASTVPVTSCDRPKVAPENNIQKTSSAKEICPTTDRLLWTKVVAATQQCGFPL